MYCNYPSADEALGKHATGFKFASLVGFLNLAVRSNAFGLRYEEGVVCVCSAGPMTSGTRYSVYYSSRVSVARSAEITNEGGSVSSSLFGSS